MPQTVSEVETDLMMTAPDAIRALRAPRIATMTSYDRFLLALDALHREHGSDATVREMAAMLGVGSTGHIAWLRNKLTARGLVTYRRHRMRTLRLTAAGQEWVDVRTGRRRSA